jgi:hypothetical protein
MTHWTIHKTFNIALNEPAERVLRKLTLKDNSRTLSRRGCRHFARQELHDVLGIPAQSISNFLKIVDHGTHANPRILQPG